jgi:hypothetical protein
MLTKKWKLFRIIQVAALAIYIPVVLLDIYGILTKPVTNNFLAFFIMSQIIFMLISFIYCGNIFLNFRLLVTAFSHEQSASTNRKISVILLISFFIVLTGLIIVFTSVLYSEFIEKKPYVSPSKSLYSFILVYLFTLIVSGIYISIMQVKLLRIIRYNKKKAADNTIEAIGSAEKEG